FMPRVAGTLSQVFLPRVRDELGLHETVTLHLTIASASDPGAPAAGTEAGFSLGPGDLISLGWRLGLVALIIGGSIVGLRWWARRMAAPASTTGFLRVVDTLPISSGRTIHLLALGDRVIAIGATPQQITMLEALTPEEAERVLAAADAKNDPLPLGDFAAQLLESLRRGEQRAAREPVIGAEPRRQA
ncbi:MAG: flagellar biosynthetic protein FliO, partial [Tepidiforma sp.]